MTDTMDTLAELQSRLIEAQDEEMDRLLQELGLFSKIENLHENDRQYIAKHKEKAFIRLLDYAEDIGNIETKNQIEKAANKFVRNAEKIESDMLHMLSLFEGLMDSMNLNRDETTVTVKYPNGTVDTRTLAQKIAEVKLDLDTLSQLPRRFLTMRPNADDRKTVPDW